MLSHLHSDWGLVWQRHGSIPQSLLLRADEIIQ
jgi:hypothetical protein